MATLDFECQIFDPIRITTVTRANRFIIDTWFSTGLIARSLFERLPGIETHGTGRLLLSSGMTVDRPRIRVGIQINNIRALPVEFFVVDDGPAPLLFGSDFLKELFNVGRRAFTGSGGAPPDGPVDVTIEPADKYDPDSVGVRLVPLGDSIDALQLERFLRAVRAIHNVGVIAQSGLHQHEDWPQAERTDAKRRAVHETIQNDRSLHSDNTLSITWVEAGSIWVSLGSGAKSALSWITQVFEKTMDARLRSVMADATSAEEDAAIKHMTRDEVARAKKLEQQRLSAQHIRETREEWHKMVLAEIDFRRKLAQQIKDPDVRAQATQSLGEALGDLVDSDFMPLVEHLPDIPAKMRDPLPVISRQNPRDGDLHGKQR